MDNLDLDISRIKVALECTELIMKNMELLVCAMDEEVKRANEFVNWFRKGN